MDIVINEVEQDIIKELINIGLAKSADSFAQIAKDNVLLSVPDVQIMEPDTVLDFFPESSQTDTVVQSDVKGDLNGKTFIVFTEMQSNRLADLCLGGSSNFQGNYPAMKRSLLLEISNILTGALVTQLANLLSLHLYGTPPMIVPYAIRKNFKELISDLPLFKPFVLTVKTQFVNSGKLVEMPLLIVFDMDTVQKVLTIIRNKSAANSKWLTHPHGSTVVK
jgi:chemotaxis protein CheC